MPRYLVFAIVLLIGYVIGAKFPTLANKMGIS